MKTRGRSHSSFDAEKSSVMSDARLERAKRVAFSSATTLGIAPDIHARLARVFTQDDTFTVLFILTRRKSPQTPEEIFKTHGGPLDELRDRLQRLHALGLVQRKGHAYSATPEASAAVFSLEEEFKGFGLPVSNKIASDEGPIAANNVNAADHGKESRASTNNSTWFAVTASTASSSPESNEISTEPITSTTPSNGKEVTASADQDRRPGTDESATAVAGQTLDKVSDGNSHQSGL
jgi:hypothetical protein